ncbi:glycosyltransferase family 2 protein [Phenylobacterium sp. LjRoot225]|uniref:glycosyltransferase n=1 Tax=Phenylobacterium sp. LjRoot225 TaxID=3342285 RepID=UPI003ECF63B0
MSQDEADRASRPVTAARAPEPLRRLELSVVVPTFNEVANVEPLIRKLETALAGIEWQAIFVDDDSPDGTAEAVKAIAADDGRIACLRRIGRRGLAGAVIEGALASAAPYVAVIDGDMQHDESLLPAMLQVLRGGQTDLVIGSRYLEPEARVVNGLEGHRAWGSRFANWLGRRALAVDLTDPVSGFFMARREVIDRVAPKLAASGFKVLFDIVASQPQPLRCVELGYEFRPRVAGESKLDNGVVAQYLSLLGSKMTKDVISPRALMFLAVGGSGVVVQLAALEVLRHFGMQFAAAQTVAALLAMTSNFLINNTVTYRDRRKHGWGMAVAYARFCLLCSAGLAANVGVATIVRPYVPADWIASVAGAGVGAGWNYVTTALAVW